MRTGSIILDVCGRIELRYYILCCLVAGKAVDERRRSSIGSLLTSTYLVSASLCHNRTATDSSDRISSYPSHPSLPFPPTKKNARLIRPDWT